jgi:hypothetical protein
MFLYINECTGVTNDVNFVAGVWQDLMAHDYFTGIRTIHIWSDGGPHHFRVSANMWIFTQLQQHFSGFLFKKQVQTVRRNEKRSIDSSTILIDTLNTLNNHISIAATALDAPRLKVETFDGTSIAKIIPDLISGHVRPHHTQT